VCKARLDAALRPGDESFDVTNNQRGIAALVKRLKKLRVSRIVLEASGGYEIAKASELAAVSLPVAVVNPCQVRDFARATGRLAKTDATLEYWRILPKSFNRKLDRCRMRKPVS
jgi:transposase